LAMFLDDDGWLRQRGVWAEDVSAERLHHWCILSRFSDLLVLQLQLHVSCWSASFRIAGTARETLWERENREVMYIYICPYLYLYWYLFIEEFEIPVFRVWSCGLDRLSPDIYADGYTNLLSSDISACGALFGATRYMLTWMTMDNLWLIYG
jgi:hypothetical protein